MHTRREQRMESGELNKEQQQNVTCTTLKYDFLSHFSLLAVLRSLPKHVDERNDAVEMADDDGIIKLRIRFGGISNSSLFFFFLSALHHRCEIFQFLRELTHHRHRVKIKAKSFFSYKSIKMMNGFPPQRNATRVAAGALTSSKFPSRAENFCHKKITVYECSQRVEIVEVESLPRLRKIPCRSLNHVEYKVVRQ